MAGSCFASWCLVRCSLMIRHTAATAATAATASLCCLVACSHMHAAALSIQSQLHAAACTSKPLSMRRGSKDAYAPRKDCLSTRQLLPLYNQSRHCWSCLLLYNPQVKSQASRCTRRSPYTPLADKRHWLVLLPCASRRPTCSFSSSKGLDLKLPGAFDPPPSCAEPPPRLNGLGCGALPLPPGTGGARPAMAP